MTDRLHRLQILNQNESIEQLQVSVLRQYLKKDHPKVLLEDLNEECQSKLDLISNQVLKEFDAQVIDQNKSIN